jgi:hypothetical protein
MHDEALITGDASSITHIRRRLDSTINKFATDGRPALGPVRGAHAATRVEQGRRGRRGGPRARGERGERGENDG